MLLIVPYGIETLPGFHHGHGIHVLLIVPYGIETADPLDNGRCSLAFNRTLWN